MLINRPLLFLDDDEGSLRKMTKKEWRHPLNSRYYDLCKTSLSLRSTNALEQYLAILKANVEVWSTWNNGYSQTLTSVGIVLLTLIATWLFNLVWQFNGDSKVSTISGFITGLLLIISLWVFLYPIREAAIKKAKATFIIQIVESILRERQGRLSTSVVH